MSSRPAWSVEHLPGYLGLHNVTLSQKGKERKKNKKQTKQTKRKKNILKEGLFNSRMGYIVRLNKERKQKQKVKVLS